MDPTRPPEQPGQPGFSLQNQTVLVTRPAEKADELRRILQNDAAHVIVHPTIQILAMDDFREIDRAIDTLGDVDWLVFVSANGVRFFLDRVSQRLANERLQRIQIAAFAGGTRQELNSRGIQVTAQPAQSDSRAMAELLLEKAVGTRVLIVRASRGSQEMSRRLTEAGIPFQELVVYQSVDVAQPDPQVADQLQRGEIHWVTMTSSAIAKSTIRLFGSRLKRARLVSISPTTTEVMRELGYPPTAEAKDFSMRGVVAAMQAVIDADS